MEPMDELEKKLRKWKYFSILFVWAILQIVGIVLLAVGFEIVSDPVYRGMLVMVYVVQFALCCGLLVVKLTPYRE